MYDHWLWQLMPGIGLSAAEPSDSPSSDSGSDACDRKTCDVQPGGAAGVLDPELEDMLREAAQEGIGGC